MARPRRLVIGIAGLIGAGKDTIAQRLIVRWGFARVGFADALKIEVRKNFHRTLLAIWDATEAAHPEVVRSADVNDRIVDFLIATKPPIVRELMQEYGTEVRRTDAKDYWVDRWSDSLSHRPRVVAPDCRFPNEYERIRDLGGYVLKVIREGQAPTGTHASETGVAKYPDSAFDAVFVNDQDIPTLDAAVDAWVQRTIGAQA